jgi:hypothetical protein
MRMNAGMLIGLIGGGIGLVVGVGCAIVFGGLPGLIMSVVMVGVFGGIFWPIVIKPMMTASRLRKTGVAANARIVEMNDTGVTLNNSPQVKLLLEVTPPMGQPYLVETKQYISRLQTSMYMPGNMIPVLIDPNDKNMISINYEGGVSGAGGGDLNKVPTGPWAGMSKQDAERKLFDYDAKNKEIMGYGVSARAIVSRYTWLGIYVNGQNPAVEFELQVMPTDRPAFTAVTYGVILEQSVPKYQPGEEIFVKYDPNNTTKVTIDHS